MSAIKPTGFSPMMMTMIMMNSTDAGQTPQSDGQHLLMHADGRSPAEPQDPRRKSIKFLNEKRKIGLAWAAAEVFSSFPLLLSSLI